jgi:hypothetical protein
MTFAHAFHRAATVSRATLYGTTVDRQLPLNLQDDARLPLLGFCGTKYAKGGVVLLAINPGGGGAAYVRRTSQDEILFPLIEAYVRNNNDDAVSNLFKLMSASYATQAQSWNLWRILFPVLQACGQTLDDVAYLNCFPYRTAGDALPQANALRFGWAQVVAPLLGELSPSMVIALGKKAGNVAEKYWSGPRKLFVVPRTIGDSWLSDEAKVVLSQIRDFQA